MTLERDYGEFGRWGCHGASRRGLSKAGDGRSVELSRTKIVEDQVTTELSMQMSAQWSRWYGVVGGSSGCYHHVDNEMDDVAPHPHRETMHYKGRLAPMARLEKVPLAGGKG